MKLGPDPLFTKTEMKQNTVYLSSLKQPFKEILSSKDNEVPMSKHSKTEMPHFSY